jgi:Leucine-rich repeat (LRR) protein
MKKLINRYILLSVLVAILHPGVSPIFRVKAASPQPDNSILFPTTSDVDSQTQLDVKSFDCSTVTVVPIIECQALVDLYESTNGAEWFNNTNWLEGLDVSTWYGISVTEGHISLIEMNGNNLVGDLPESITDLPYLSELCLTANSVSGSIPDTISNMLLLEKLSLDHNLLTGTIPEGLALLPNLIKISLGDNQLTGTIPSSLGDLLFLEKFEVYLNNIEGELPESLGQITTLDTLSVWNNHMITGHIPMSFTNLTNLSTFWFFNTGLCEPVDPDFIYWKTQIVDDWFGDDRICMDFHCFMPIIAR